MFAEVEGDYFGVVYISERWVRVCLYFDALLKEGQRDGEKLGIVRVNWESLDDQHRLGK